MNRPSYRRLYTSTDAYGGGIKRYISYFKSTRTRVHFKTLKCSQGFFSVFSWKLFPNPERLDSYIEQCNKAFIYGIFQRLTNTLICGWIGSARSRVQCPPGTNFIPDVLGTTGFPLFSSFYLRFPDEKTSVVTVRPIKPL